MIESVQLLHQLTNQHSLRVIHERSIKPSVDENGEEYEQANLDQPAASEKIDYSLETPTNRLIGDDYVVEDGSNLEMTSLLDVPVIEDATIDDDEDDTEDIESTDLFSSNDLPEDQVDESDQTFTQTSLPPANLSNLSHQEDPNQVSSLQLSNDPSFSSQIQIPAIMAIIACVFAVLLSIGLFTIMRLRKRREFLAIKKSFGRDVEDQIGEKEDKISQYLPGRSGGVLKLYQGLPVEDKNVHVFNYPILDQVSMV